VSGQTKSNKDTLGNQCDWISFPFRALYLWYLWSKGKNLWSTNEAWQDEPHEEFIYLNSAFHNTHHYHRFAVNAWVHITVICYQRKLPHQVMCFRNVHIQITVSENNNLCKKAFKQCNNLRHKQWAHWSKEYSHWLFCNAVMMCMCTLNISRWHSVLLFHICRLFHYRLYSLILQRIMIKNGEIYICG